MSEVVAPFLSLAEREQYLYDKYYFPRGSLDSASRQRLSEVNFHYFLGYARNFRQLHDQGHLVGEKVPAAVFDIIDLDAQVSTLLYEGIRRAEWLLRHYAVKEYCQKFDSCGSFLLPESYFDPGGVYTNEHLVQGLINDILEYSEQYVVDKIRKNAEVEGCSVPRRTETWNRDTCVKLLNNLSLWSVIDSFSLGRLVKFVERCDNSADAEDHLWKSVAVDLDIPAGRFQASMESLRSLRNHISHQSRLWMRPTTNTVTKKGQFRKKVAQCHRKAMLVSFYNVASFQGDKTRRLDFGAKVGELTESNPNYLFGVSHFGNNIVYE